MECVIIITVMRRHKFHSRAVIIIINFKFPDTVTTVTVFRTYFTVTTIYGSIFAYQYRTIPITIIYSSTIRYLIDCDIICLRSISVITACKNMYIYTIFRLIYSLGTTVICGISLASTVIFIPFWLCYLNGHIISYRCYIYIKIDFCTLSIIFITCITVLVIYIKL